MNLKSDIIHMSTKWALSFLAAKAKEWKKKKKKLGGGSHISQSLLRSRFSVLYKRHTFHHHQSSTKQYLHGVMLRAAKKFSVSFLVII